MTSTDLLPPEFKHAASLRTFVGVMDIDALRLLEDGIRSQIGARIAQTCSASLMFPRRAQPLGFGELGGLQGSGLMGLFSGGPAPCEVPDRWAAGILTCED